MADRRAGAQQPVSADPSLSPNACPVHRRHVYRGTECRYCLAGWPAVAEDEIITGSPQRIAKLSEFSRPNLSTGPVRATLAERLREVGE
jgi:hypothetical protein